MEKSFHLIGGLKVYKYFQNKKFCLAYCGNVNFVSKIELYENC